MNTKVIPLITPHPTLVEVLRAKGQARSEREQAQLWRKLDMSTRGAIIAYLMDLTYVERVKSGLPPEDKVLPVVRFSTRPH